MVLGIGGQFLIIKKNRTTGACGQSFTIYIYTVCITKRGLVTV